MSSTQQLDDTNRNAVATPFFAVSLTKLAVLSFFTSGLYEFYWFYCNWQLVRTRGTVRISPFLRTIFVYFFCYGLFARMRAYGKAHNVPGTLPAGLLAMAWICVRVICVLPDPFWLVATLDFVMLFPVQAYVNRINKTVAPEHDCNEKFTFWNWAGVIVGAVFWALVIASFFLPDE